MNRMMHALKPALMVPAAGFHLAAIHVAAALLVAALPAPAQTDTAAQESSHDAGQIGEPASAAMADARSPADITADVRLEGFYPVGRPVQRGGVYVLFAVDQDDMDVKLVIDAATGRVLTVTGAAARFGGPRYYGYRSVWHAQTLIAPTDAPSGEPAAHRSKSGSAGRHASLRHFLPRSRASDQDAPAATVPTVLVAPQE